MKAPIARLLAVTLLLAGVAGCGQSTPALPPTISPPATPLPTIPPRLLSTPGPSPTPSARHGPSPTPVVRPTPTPVPADRVIVLASPLGGAVTNRKTGMTAAVDGRRAIVRGPDLSADVYKEFIHVILTNGSKGAAEYGATNFTLVDDRGTVYQPSLSLPHAVNLPLAGLINTRHSVAGWIGFKVPRTVRTFTLLWNDNGALSPPAGLVTYPIHP